MEDVGARWVDGCRLGVDWAMVGMGRELKIQDGFPRWNDRILLLFSVEMNFFVRMV